MENKEEQLEYAQFVITELQNKMNDFLSDNIQKQAKINILNKKLSLASTEKESSENIVKQIKEKNDKFVEMKNNYEARLSASADALLKHRSNFSAETTILKKKIESLEKENKEKNNSSKEVSNLRKIISDNNEKYRKDIFDLEKKISDLKGNKVKPKKKTKKK